MDCPTGRALSMDVAARLCLSLKMHYGSGLSWSRLAGRCAYQATRRRQPQAGCELKCAAGMTPHPELHEFSTVHGIPCTAAVPFATLTEHGETGMLTENDVVEAVARHLKDGGWQIEDTKSTDQRGHDIVAARDGTVLAVEAKGGTSSKRGTHRHGLPFNSGQKRSHVSVALYKAACVLQCRALSAGDRATLGRQAPSVDRRHSSCAGSPQSDGVSGRRGSRRSRTPDFKLRHYRRRRIPGIATRTGFRGRRPDSGRRATRPSP